MRIARIHGLPLFFGLAFVLSWALWVPLALARHNLLPLELDPGQLAVLPLLGTLGPALAAMAVSLLAGGRTGLGALLGQFRRTRVGWRWYAAATMVFPALLLLAAELYKLLPGAGPLPIQPVSAGSLIATMLILTISVLGEEIGWRGFALPRLQERRSAAGASLLLGAIWTAWHLPFWTALGELERIWVGYWLLSWAYISAGAVYITWFMNNTGNALLLAFLFHWTYNVLSVGFLPLTSVVPACGIMIVLAWTLAVALVVRYGAKRLVRAGVVA